MTDWKGDHNCPLCKSEMDKFSSVNVYASDIQSVDVCWKCKTVFSIREWTLSDMRD